MSDSEYRGGTTAGSKWGCAVAALLGVPLFFFLMLVEALGDCVPDTECKKGFLVFALVPTVVVSGALFLVVRAIVNRIRQSRKGS
jgi:hypothetical protein